jgi:hypothetical protein
VGKRGSQYQTLSQGAGEDLTGGYERRGRSTNHHCQQAAHPVWSAIRGTGSLQPPEGRRGGAPPASSGRSIPPPACEKKDLSEPVAGSLLLRERIRYGSVRERKHAHGSVPLPAHLTIACRCWLQISRVLSPPADALVPMYRQGSLAPGARKALISHPERHHRWQKAIPGREGNNTHGMNRACPSFSSSPSLFFPRWSHPLSPHLPLLPA